MLRIWAFSIFGKSEDPGERICFCYSVSWLWLAFLMSFCYGSLVVSHDQLLLDHQINVCHNPLLLAHWMFPTIPCCWLCFPMISHCLFPMILCSWLSCISHDPLQVVLWTFPRMPSYWLSSIFYGQCPTLLTHWEFPITPYCQFIQPFPRCPAAGSVLFPMILYSRLTQSFSWCPAAGLQHNEVIGVWALGVEGAR